MNDLDFRKFPTTRYQGSKRKLLPWLYSNIKKLKFNSVIDIFGGTASVSILFKKMGKITTFNDYLKFNYYAGKALIENRGITLDDADINFLLKRHDTIIYNSYVQNTFSGIYYTDEENAWIDVFLCNWRNLDNIYSPKVALYKKAIAFTAFSQSALRKRPFNLFHRANLYMRLNEVQRTFGNKTSWEGTFDTYFKYFIKEINASIFDNKKNNKALNMRASDLIDNERYDLIYIDPPYIRKEAYGADVNYLKFYHFLEGACDFENWKDRIDYNTKNYCIKDEFNNEWIYPNKNKIAFDNLFRRFRKSKFVISYKEPGIPSKKELVDLIRKYKKKVISVRALKYDYALNKNNGYHKEYLLIGLDK